MEVACKRPWRVVLCAVHEVAVCSIFSCPRSIFIVIYQYYILILNKTNRTGLASARRRKEG